MHLQVRLISEAKLKHREHLKYRTLQSSLFKLWDDYANNMKTASQLLKACANLVPVPN